MSVPQSQVWVEDQDQKHQLMEEYKSNLRYVHNHQATQPSSQVLSFPPSLLPSQLHCQWYIDVCSRDHDYHPSLFLSTAKNIVSILIWAMERVRLEVAASIDMVGAY